MRRRCLGAAVCAAFLTVLFCAVCCADTWVVATISTDAWLADNITFSNEGGKLLLSNSYIYQPGGSSSWSRTLFLAGRWGVCGTVQDGALIPYLYAHFVIDNNEVPEYVPQIDYGGFGLYFYVPYVDDWTSPTTSSVTWCGIRQPRQATPPICCLGQVSRETASDILLRGSMVAQDCDGDGSAG